MIVSDSTSSESVQGREEREAEVRTIAPDSLNDLSAAAVDNDPFRLSNSPPGVRYTPGWLGSVHTLPAVNPPAGRPSLVLKGIVGGPPWLAIVDGLPGVPSSTVVRIGDRVGGITVRDIRPDVVTLAGADTTWRLAMRRIE
jgi:hypothetical protein